MNIRWLQDQVAHTVSPNPGVSLPYLLTLSAQSTGLHCALQALQTDVDQLHAGAQRPSSTLVGDPAAAPADNDSGPYSTTAPLAGHAYDTNGQPPFYIMDKGPVGHVL